MYKTHSPFWKQAPFIRLLPCFIIGILLQSWVDIPVLFITLVVVLLLAYHVLIRFQSISKQFKYLFSTGISIYLLVICLGCFVCWCNNITHHHNWIGHYQTKDKGLLIRLLNTPVERKKSYKTKAAILQIRDNNKWISLKGKILVYLDKENHSLKQGDVLFVKQQLQSIATQVNPGGFDYAAYLNRQQIYHQLYIGAAQYQKISQEKPSIVGETKSYVLSVIRKYIRDKQQQAIAEALLVGYTFDIDDALSEAYSRTGVIHIIAISGMHLGLLYTVLVLLTGNLKRPRGLRWLRPLLILLCLWFFTILVGAGASVLRAAVIISFFIIGEWLERKANPYNSLCASMFLLLSFNPNYLWDIGFQLSYTAVAGIMIFNKAISKWYYIPYKPVQYCWQLIAVTISAQILTLPVVLFHFHQFPNFFLITNLLIVPLSGIVLYSCFVLVLISPINLLAAFIGQVLNMVLGWMNNFIVFAASLPFAVTEKIQVSMFQVACYFLSTITLSIWVSRKKKYYLLTTIVIICTGMIDETWRRIELRRLNKLVIYYSPGKPVSEVFSGKKYISFGDSSSLQPTRKMRMSTQTVFGGLYQKMVINPAEKPIIKVNNLIMAWYNNKVVPIPNTNKYNIDIMVVQSNPDISIGLLHKRYKAKIYVLDINNPLWKIRKWKKEADSLHLRHHSVPEQGAFVMDF